VLPEHCDLIYYGHCRSTLQCNICDKNRKKLAAAFPDREVEEYPETYCQKMPEGHLDGDLHACGKHGTGCCVPCKRCSTYSNFGEHRLAWEGSVDTVDCRVPRVCPHALDDLDKKHGNKIEKMEEEIADLQKGLQGESLTDDERTKLQKEAASIQDDIEKQQDKAKNDPMVLNKELENLWQDKKNRDKDLKAYKEKYGEGCKNGVKIQDDGEVVDCESFQDYHTRLAQERFEENTKKTMANRTGIIDEHGTQKHSESLDKLFKMFGNTQKMLNKSIEELKGDMQDERQSSKGLQSNYTSLQQQIRESLAQLVGSDEEKTASGSKGVSMETIAAVTTMLLLFALTIIIVLVFRNRNANETDEQKESSASLLYAEGDPGGSEQDDFQKSMKTLIETESKEGNDYAGNAAAPAATVRVKPAKAEKMQAWDNYDEDESMQLSEGQLGESSGQLGEPSSMFPMADPAMSGYNEDDLNGQLGYVTREFDPPSLRNARGMPSRKIASQTFVNESGC